MPMPFRHIVADVELESTTSALQPIAVRLAIAFAVGISIGWWIDEPFVWPWLLLSGLTFLFAIFVSRFSSIWFVKLLILTVVFLGASWLVIKHYHVPPHHLAAVMNNEPALIRARGTALTPPIIRDRAAGSMALYNHEQPATFFRLKLTSLVDRDGSETPYSGQLLVRCEETITDFRTGDHLELYGRLSTFKSPQNPGEFDRATYARVLGQAGMLVVPQRELITVIERKAGNTIDRLVDWRQEFRQRASGWLLSNLPADERAQRDALLSALLLGERGPDLIDLGETFRRVGLAHLLAISGLHLGVLAGVVLFIFRLSGRSCRWHGWMLIAVVLVYLFLIEARLPVMRAAIMTCAASLGIALGQRLRISGLVAFSAIALLIWRPQQLFDAGFQLSYGVVLGLIYFSPSLRRRWFGPRKQLAGSVSTMLGQWFCDIAAGSVVAWLIATPLVAYHFGLITPLAAIASVFALPLVTILLAVGYCKILLGALLPSVALFLNVPLTISADVLVSIVEAIDALPFSVVRVPHPSVLWTLAALAIICAWLVHESRALRNRLFIATTILLIWIALPAITLNYSSSLRMDMLAVGDGSCYIIRSDGTTVLFDAGSSTNLNAGYATIIPALERLYVRSIDAIVVSHANLDHYSAVIELVDRFDVGTLFFTRQYLNNAEKDPLGPAAFLHTELTDRLVSIRIVNAGDRRTFGKATWTWLHPDKNATFKHVNDESTVIRIESAGRRILLTGDIQRTAMATLMQDHADLNADIIELPHHGSYHDLAAEFINRVNPEIVLQSTGTTRYLRDDWKEILKDKTRLITARDGACWVEIQQDGKMFTGMYIQSDL